MSDQIHSELTAMGDLMEDVLSLLQKVGTDAEKHKAVSDDFRKRYVRVMQLNQDLISSNAQSTMATNNLLMALIEELALAKTVDPARVAARHLSKMKTPPVLFQRSTLAHAKTVGDILSHPGFPDEVPPARGAGPVLIVDNDPEDS